MKNYYQNLSATLTHNAVVIFAGGEYVTSEPFDSFKGTRLADIEYVLNEDPTDVHMIVAYRQPIHFYADGIYMASIDYKQVSEKAMVELNKCKDEPDYSDMEVV